MVPPGQAKADWTIVRALSEVLGARLPYDDVASVRARMAQVAPHFAASETVQPSVWLNGDTYAHRTASTKTDAAPLASSVANFFQTDSISRASVTMARCTATYNAP